MTNNCPKIQKLITSLKTLKQELDAGLLSLPKDNKEGKDKVAKLWLLKEQIEAKMAELKIEADPYKFWKKYKNGENILHFKGEVRVWRTHPQGVVNMIETDKYLLNNGAIIKDGFAAHDNFYDFLSKRITREDNKYYFDGKLVYDETLNEYYDWEPHPQGVIIKKDKQIWLNNKVLLYEGVYDDVQSHPHGIIIQKNNGTGADFIFYDHWPVEEKKFGS